MIMTVDVNVDGERFEPGQPRPLFDTGIEMPSADVTPDFLYDVTEDGERFLINQSVGAGFGALPAAETSGVITVIVNWAANLERP
jgi:hypothetical protein